MASLVPSSIGQTLTTFSGGIDNIVSNVTDVIKTVDSVYDQLTGKSQNVPSQTAQLTSPTATTPTSPTPTAAGFADNKMLTLGIGAVVVVTVLLAFFSFKD